MRLLFAHDHRFYNGPAGELYTLGSFPSSIWERYLRHFEELHVVGRDGGPLPAGAQLARADCRGVTFQFLSTLASFRQFVLPSAEVSNSMHAAVSSADAVVARLPSEIGLLAVQLARRLGKPYAVEVVGCVWDSFLHHGALAARIYAPLAFVRTRRAIAQAPLALYVTSSWLQRRYPNTGAWVSASNVCLLPFGQVEMARRESRLAALSQGERPVLGTIASLQTRYKGVQTALEALAILRRSGLELTYRVLGPGAVEPWEQLAQRFGVSDLVHFDGTRKAGDDVCEWLDEIDIYLQPSFTEGLPRGVIEAMSRGAVCVGSNRGGIPELLPPDRLHRPGDVRGLSALVHRFACDPAAIVTASLRDREMAQQFGPEILERRRSEIYARLRAMAERRQAGSDFGAPSMQG